VRQSRLAGDEGVKDPPVIARSTADALAPMPPAPTPAPTPDAATTTPAPEPEEPDASGNSLEQCEFGKSGCKSVCRWLKLTDKDIKSDTGSSCPLFEWSLKTCGYVAPEDRPDGSDADPIDCSVNIIRKAVFWPELENTISSLGTCITGLPSSANKTCGVALALVQNEISDLKDEMALKKSANIARKNLQKASAQARIALDTKSNEQAAVEVLAGNLSSAENISGHYLTEDIHIARDYLDRLGPIPAVRQELEDAMADGRLAMDKKEVVAFNDAIVRLNISVTDGNEYKLNTPLPEAQKMLDGLLVMRARMVEYQTIVFDANVSLGTRTKMAQAIVALKYGINQANTSNFTKGLPQAVALLDRLKETNDALKDLKWATHHGSVLLDSQKKGKENLEEALRWLNTSFSFAQSLRVLDDETTVQAAEVLDKLQYVYGARVALQKAIAMGSDVLSKNGSVLANDSEEIAIDLLDPAIAWAYDVGIQGGLSAAEAMRDELSAVEQAKENMTGLC